MKIFAPNELIAAVDRIARQHPLVGEQVNDLRPELVEGLVRRIDQRAPEELEMLAKSLTRRQVQTLCLYLPNNVYQVDLQKISSVIGFKMTADCIAILFRQWQKYPRSQECLALLGQYDSEEFRPDSFPLKVGLMKKWATASQPLLAVTRTISDMGVGGNFFERTKSLGFRTDSNLVQFCYLLYLCNATVRQLQIEGDAQIAYVLSKQSNENQIKVFMRILTCGANQRQLLTQLPRTYSLAYAVWGVPDKNLFKGNDLFNTYLWWYNYNQLIKSLNGDMRRIRFWQQYLDRCQCTRVTGHQMLIMRFGNRVVTEFEVQGPVYIYAADYFDGVVASKMNVYGTAGLKSWMFNYSDYLSRETHMANWESKQYTQLRSQRVI